MLRLSVNDNILEHAPAHNLTPVFTGKEINAYVIYMHI
jgi:hypothetical protein